MTDSRTPARTQMVTRMDTRMDTRMVETERGRFCVAEHGDGEPVVLLHGTSASLGVWGGVIELLPPGVATVAVDQRGHGRSVKPPHGYTATDFTDDLERLLAALELGRVLIVGHSLGARNAVVLAARRPDLVRGVVAVDYTPYVEAGVLDELETRVRGGDRHFSSADDVRTYLRERYPLITDDAVERRLRFGYRPDGDGLRPWADPDAMAATVDGLRTDFDRELAVVDCPVTILRGEHSRIVSSAAAARTRREYPHCRLDQLDGVDHYIPEERPDLVVDALAGVRAATGGR